MSWWERYRERLGGDRELVVGGGWYGVRLMRGPFRSEVEVRAPGLYGRRLCHRTMRDADAEQAFDSIVAILADDMGHGGPIEAIQRVRDVLGVERVRY